MEKFAGTSSQKSLSGVWTLILRMFHSLRKSPSSDAEGAEYEILTGTPPEIFERIRFITAEDYTKSNAAESLEAAVRHLGDCAFEVTLRTTEPDTGILFASRIR